MKAKGTFAAWVLVGLLVVLLAGGCNRDRSRCFEVPPVMLVSDMTINGTGQDLPGGITIDPQELTFEFEICDLPTEADIREQFSGIPILERVTSHIEITGVNVIEATLMADRAWDFMESLTIDYVPKPVDGVEQDPVVLGTAAAPAGGFGANLAIEMDSSFDLLTLMHDEEENPGEGCPKLRATFVGVLPEESLTFDVQVSFDVCVSFTL